MVYFSHSHVCVKCRKRARNFFGGGCALIKAFWTVSQWVNASQIAFNTNISPTHTPRKIVESRRDLWLILYLTSWLSVRRKTLCKLHKMCFRRFVGPSTSRVFKIQNGCHVNKGKMRFYSPCGSCFVVKPSVCILPLVCSLQSAFYPWSAFYPRSAVCSPQSAFYTDRTMILAFSWVWIQL